MSAPSIYRQVMGPAYDTMPAPLRVFHALQGRAELVGRVRIDAPEGRFARLLARCLGTPLQAQEGTIRFELQADASGEVWIRHFPASTLRSSLYAQEGRIVERMGIVGLHFVLAGDASGLAMRLALMTVFGLPCPARLLPAVIARETGREGRLHFHVEAALPFVGRVARYRGHLELPTGASG